MSLYLSILYSHIINLCKYIIHLYYESDKTVKGVSMFQIHIGISNKDNDLVYTFDNKEIVLNIGNVTSKVPKVALTNPDQFAIVNKLIYDTGIAGELYDIYVDAKNVIYALPSKEDIVNLLYRVLDLITPAEIAKYLKDNGVMVPSTIVTTFDFDREIDLLATRDQTYVKEEYYGLLGIIVLTKLMMPIVSYSMRINKDLYLESKPYMSALNMVSQHKFFKSPEMERFKAYVAKHIENIAKTQANLDIAALKNDIISDEFPEFIMSIALFKRFPIDIIPMLPAPTGHPVASIFSYIKSKVAGQDAIANRYNVKSVFTSGGDEETRSVFEGYPQTTNFSPGNLVEMDVVYSNPYQLYKLLGGKNKLLLKEVIESMSPLLKVGMRPNKTSVILTSAVLHRLIDARSINNISRDAYVNAASVAVTHLVDNGFTSIAKLIGIAPIHSDDVINETLAIQKIPNTLRDKLNEYYSIKKEIKKRRKSAESEASDIVVDTIYQQSSYLFEKNYFYCLPKHIAGDKLEVVIPNTVRVDLAHFYIALAEEKI